MFTRLTATVIISAPEASCACTMTAGDEYLPVPTMSREENVLSDIVNRSIFQPLPAADKVDDLDFVALADRRTVERVALEHGQIVLDRHAPGVDLQPRQQFGDRQRTGELMRAAVQRDGKFPEPI